jgi:hypothetical protein
LPKPPHIDSFFFLIAVDVRIFRSISQRKGQSSQDLRRHPRCGTMKQSARDALETPKKRAWSDGFLNEIVAWQISRGGRAGHGAGEADPGDGCICQAGEQASRLFLVLFGVRMKFFAIQLEYDNIEGMILLSELSRRRIRSIQKLIRVGRNEVVVVMRVDKEKGVRFFCWALTCVWHYTLTRPLLFFPKATSTCQSEGYQRRIL